MQDAIISRRGDRRPRLEDAPPIEEGSLAPSVANDQGRPWQNATPPLAQLRTNNPFDLTQRSQAAPEAETAPVPAGAEVFPWNWLALAVLVALAVLWWRRMR